MKLQQYLTSYNTKYQFRLQQKLTCVTEQPSSSSISTTTSSVTSMTSLESKGVESMSDYEDHWDSEQWGDMEVFNNVQWTGLNIIHNLAYPSILYTVYCIIESRGGKFILCGKQNPYSKK